MQKADLANEWSLLQNQFDNYEKYSLLIKLSAIGLLAVAYLLNNLTVFVFFLLLILWFQDAIWKTFQLRIETRLLQLEDYLSGDGLLDNDEVKAYQFNNLFLQNRPSSVTLFKEYMRQAIRPTIAFPYVLLLLMSGFKLLL